MKSLDHDGAEYSAWQQRVRVLVKSPLRYPGGKSKAIGKIMPHILSGGPISEFREPFVGGGSVFLAVKQHFGVELPCAINDLNPDVVAFWRYVKLNAEALARAVSTLRDDYQGNGRGLYHSLREAEPTTDFDRAIRFFIMNRITFSGVMDAGGYSQQAFDTRFTPSSVDRLRKVAPLLANVTITQGDYEPMLHDNGEGVFIFLDPPYHSATHSKLYGKDGHLHTSFDHVRFAENMRRCPHRWLITYDDSEYVRGLFSFATVQGWELQYGMNNYKQGRAAIGKELFIVPTYESEGS